MNAEILDEDRWSMGEAEFSASASRENLHDGVVSHLRDLIVEGHLKAGERIPERRLCETLGISRTPLREALKVLAAEGLIDLLPNRGARVRAFTRKDAQDCFELLAALEFAAGRLACERISDVEVAEIERLHYEMYGHYMRRELPGYFQLNQMIHEALVTASRNDALQASYRNLTSRLRQLRYSANKIERDRWGQAMREHEQMIDALRRRDGAELGNILFLHLMNKWSAASETLSSGAGGPAERDAS